MNIPFITSICKPTKLNKEPFGTFWQYVPDEDQDAQWFVQTSRDKADWKTAGEVFFRAFRDMIIDQDMVQLVLALYETNGLQGKK